jgi:hypothetical protein
VTTATAANTTTAPRCGVHPDTPTSVEVRPGAQKLTLRLVLHAFTSPRASAAARHSGSTTPRTLGHDSHRPASKHPRDAHGGGGTSASADAANNETTNTQERMDAADEAPRRAFTAADQFSGA